MYDISYPGIVHWNKMVFEKLGYMVLAFNHGHYDATESYKECISRLIEAIEENIEKGVSNDRKSDYESMKNNLNILLEHCEKDFNLKNNNNNNKLNNNNKSNKAVSVNEVVINAIKPSNSISSLEGGKRKVKKPKNKSKSKSKSKSKK